MPARIASVPSELGIPIQWDWSDWEGFPRDVWLGHCVRVCIDQLELLHLFHVSVQRCLDIEWNDGRLWDRICLERLASVCVQVYGEGTILRFALPTLSHNY
jgi:hypothetical protein